MTDAIVVGSGPNGLAAAVTLARAGAEVTVLEAASEVGGGTRTSELDVAGVLHDACSAVHPLGAASPFFRSLDLERHGLTWRWPEVDLAHPLEKGAAVLVRSIHDTASGLGRDGPAWAATFGPPARSFRPLAEDVMGPRFQLPRHPVGLSRFGWLAARPADMLARRWHGEPARSLFAGVSAHSVQPLSRPFTSAAGVVLIAAAHHIGWPVAQGGSHRITRALASVLVELGGTIETGIEVRSVSRLPPCGAVLLDLAPPAAARVAGDRIPDGIGRALRTWRFGPGAFKLDLVVDGGVPWIHDACRRAGTVHCGGTLEEIAAAELDVARGLMPRRPFVLVAQQYLADPGRSKGDLHPVWAYAHVPNGYSGDATVPIIDQIERFAPGLRSRIVASHAQGPRDLEQHNANYVGGDIACGANDPWQTVIRPRLALDPYVIGPGLFLCSAATPPGAGVHGMCGYHAARSALRYLGA
jgi:phytoene dehydrogenase-like protein